MSYRISVSYPDGSRQTYPDAHDDLKQVCERAIAVADDLGRAQIDPTVSCDIFVEILDDADALQIAIGVVPRRADTD